MTTDRYGELRDAPPPLAAPSRALALGAHPDDIEFGCGGTLAKWAAAGCHVVMAIMTDGSKGTWDPSMEPGALVQQRRDEQDTAARALGATEVVWLGHTDGEVVYSMDLRAQVCRLIREHRPDVFLSHDPWQRYQLHPDHRATGTAAVDGMVAARDHLFFPQQGLGPHRPSAMLLWSADVVDHWEPLAEGDVAAKLAALLAHESQGTTTMGGAEVDVEKRAEFEDRIRTWVSEQGSAAGIPAAESFKRLTP
ncbi:MAG: PIG-L family deacetylase [Acidimicrobiia bacterium]|nr:PIG-L family deacetylase [Acidimicrobiia bacterium]MBT8214719.1 PIG-L family deacetylase [Acidimicrobiia bacterium]NNK91571.1 PIG-L family deacetylase [Acidimicrobiia bacterium]